MKFIFYLQMILITIGIFAIGINYGLGIFCLFFSAGSKVMVDVAMEDITPVTVLAGLVLISTFICYVYFNSGTIIQN